MHQLSPRGLDLRVLKWRSGSLSRALQEVGTPEVGIREEAFPEMNRLTSGSRH